MADTGPFEDPDPFDWRVTQGASSGRIAAIHRALAHPRFYDGDMGADIRWLLANVAALKQELIGANEMKAKYEQSAAQGWANYRELKVARDGLLSLVEMWQEVDRSEAPTAGRYIALTDRRDTWLARHRAEAGRCDGRYPVPQTSPPRDEPFDVTYRCGLPNGHEGPHRSEP